MTATESVKTSELRNGDRVANDVMVLLIDRDLEQTRHQVNEHGKTWATPAIIENADELVARRDAGDGHAGWILAVSQRDENGVYRWTIQGNDLARWARVVDGPMWNTDITWRQDVATTSHTELPDQPDRATAASALAEYATDRDLRLVNATHTATAASWDLMDSDNEVVGAAAIAIAEVDA
jgi:hypothetical protein